MSVDFWIGPLEDHVRKGKDPKEFLMQFSEQASPQLAEALWALYQEGLKKVKHLKDPRSLVGKSYADWYGGPRDDDKCWPALERFLIDEKGWDADGPVASLNEASTKILSLCPPPGMGEFRARGLVLGFVQSGKTANFTALIAKAADAGYRLFIVLGGLYDSLRNQTQKRLDQELVHLNPEMWYGLTDAETDFRGQTAKADFALQHRCLAVVKKNSSRMERLIHWLSQATPAVRRSCPVLIIDDEADQASLNASRYDDQRTKINQRLIDLLQILPKHAYVGYTATPFANVLVEPYPESGDSLYPRDFIVTLDQPPQYFGAERLFGRGALIAYDDDEGSEPLDVIRHVDLDEEPHLKPVRSAEAELFEPAVVPSLARALEYFWLACAVRRARGQASEHSTMLVHTHQRILVHRRFRPMLDQYRKEFLEEVTKASSATRTRLRSHWESEYQRGPTDDLFPERTSFGELWPELPGVVQDCVVIMENGEADERLDFDNDQRIRIVVGGTTLSRGLTLEGLVVSYFIRSAGAYDTLLQMGRWFGYRMGYEDLPRIWITPTLEEDFRTLALVEAEIRRDIERYEEYGLTPDQLAVRIRKHPTLAVTSRYKMRAANEVQVSFAGARTQTTAFYHEDHDVLSENLRSARRLFRRAHQDQEAARVPNEAGPGKQIIRDVPGDIVLEFLLRYRAHPGNRRFRGDKLCDYVKKRLDHGALLKWHVVAVGRAEGGDTTSVDLGLPERVTPVRRSRLRSVETHADIGVLTSSIDFEADLEDPEASREVPLLLVYVVDKDSPSRPKSASRIPLQAKEHVVGIALAFPPVDPDRDQATYVAVDLPVEPSADDDYEEIPEIDEQADP